MELTEYCAKYIAMLRASYLMYQNFHWITSGPSFYGNHLLFERLYKSSQDNADLAAEKLIGNFGSDALSIKNQAAFISEYLTGDDDIIQDALSAEKTFLAFSQEFYDYLEQEKKLTLGIDDAIMGIASSHEEHVYLLQQTQGTKMTKLNTLARKFQIKLAQVANQSVKPAEQLETPVPFGPPPPPAPTTPLANIDPQTGKPFAKAPFKMVSDKPAVKPVAKPAVKPVEKPHDLPKDPFAKDPYSPIMAGDPFESRSLAAGVPQDFAMQYPSIANFITSVEPRSTADNKKVLYVNMATPEAVDPTYTQNKLKEFFPGYNDIQLKVSRLPAK